MEIVVYNNKFINGNEIQELIYDKNDVEEYIQEHVGIVYYYPYLTQEYQEAGIN